MEKPRHIIHSMALDMKVPEDGPIQILEFMPAYMAGNEGYHQLHGIDMNTQVILPYLREALDEPVEEIGYLDEDAPLSMLGYTYGHDIASYGSGIIYPRRDTDNEVGGGSIVMTRADLQFARNHPEFTFVSADQQMLLMQENKAAQACLIAEDKILREFYVPTHLTTTTYDKGLADRITKNIGPAQYYVVKPVDQSQGNGVRIIPAEDLDKTLHHMLVDLRQYKKEKAGRDFWKTDISPVMVVQPYIPSRPVKYKGRDYDGTLRTFITVHREADSTSWDVEIHDGYWKLPSTPLKKGKVQMEQLVSHSPHRHESNGKKDKKFWNKRMDSAPITRSLYREIVPQVHEFCERLPAVVETKSLYQRTWGNLTHRSLERQAAGISMALNGEYYPGDIHDPLPLNRNQFPAKIYKRIKDLCLKNEFGNAAENYVRALMKPGLSGYFSDVQYYYGSQYYVPWGFLMNLEEDEKFQQQMKDRQKAPSPV